MNRTEWYLTGGLIAAGVVILILLYLIFKGSSIHGVFVETDSKGVPTETGQEQVTDLNAAYVTAVNTETQSAMAGQESADSLLAQGQTKLTREDFDRFGIPYTGNDN